MKKIGKKALFLILLLPLACVSVNADSSAGVVKADSYIDWEGGDFVLETSFSFNDKTPLSPELRLRALNSIRRELPSLFLQQVSGLVLDSRTLVGDVIESSPQLGRRMMELADHGRPVRANFAEDFSRFTQVFRYRIFPEMAESFITHRTAAAQIAELKYVPTGSYSGIVIFVEEELPLYGTHRTAALEPALFPQIYDADMNLVFDKYMVDPERILEWGPVRYFQPDEMDRIHSRVGELPLYIYASSLFGTHPADLIISNRSAGRIRASDHMLSLLKEGKIAIIYTHTSEASKGDR